MPACPEIQAKIKYRAQVRTHGPIDQKICPQVGDIFEVEYLDINPAVVAYRMLAVVEERDCGTTYLPYRELNEDGSPTKFTGMLGMAVWHLVRQNS